MRIKITSHDPKDVGPVRVYIYEATGHVQALDKFRKEHPEQHECIAIAETIKEVTK